MAEENPRKLEMTSDSCDADSETDHTPIHVPDSVLSTLTDGESRTNKSKILCQRCPSLVLSTHQAKLVKKEFFLPNMFQKNEKAPLEGVTLTDYWLVSDMMTFDNVGFSKTVDNIKYLICADCEVGPIGWHSVHDKTAYYIAVARVKHG